MHRSDDQTTTPAPERLSGADARSAGWALSGVTVLVLVAGLLVIRSTRTETDSANPSRARTAALPSRPDEPPRKRTIVLEAADTPTDSRRRRDRNVLPATGTATTARPSEPPFNRL